jgi:hypothetical protein
MKGKAQGLTEEWEPKNGDGKGRFFDCDCDYNNQGSVVEGFPMSEVVCLVSRVVMSRLFPWLCIQLGGQHQIICQGACLPFVIPCWSVSGAPY